MNKALLNTAIFLVLISNVFAIGLAMPPSKSFDAYIGKNFSIGVTVINQEDRAGNYSVTFSGSLQDRAKAEPQTVTIYPPLDVGHRGNPGEDGIARIQVMVNSTGLTPGTYDLEVSASVAQLGSGALNVIQKVSRDIEVHYTYPPSLINRILNAIFSGVKKAFNWVAGGIVTFYRHNLWLNYMFAMMVLAVVFYVGMRLNAIIAYLGKLRKAAAKEFGRMRKYGFRAWLKKKYKDRFKKLKARDKKEEKGHDDEEEDTAEQPGD